MIFDGYWRLELAQSKMKLRVYKMIGCLIHTEYLYHKINKEILLSAVAVRKIIENEQEFKGRGYYNTPHYPIPCKEVKIDDGGNEYLEDPVDIDFNKVVRPPELPILNLKVPVTKYPFIGDEDFILNKPNIEYYDQKNRESMEIPLREVCNQIIHSYIWGMITSNYKEVYGVLMVSDKHKKDYIYLLRIDDWINVLKKCALESIA